MMYKQISLAEEKKFLSWRKTEDFSTPLIALKKEGKDAFWTFDTTVQYVGKQRIPNTASNPTNLQLPEFSDAYMTWNAQIAHNLNKNIRAYLGGENLTGNSTKKSDCRCTESFRKLF